MAIGTPTLLGLKNSSQANPNRVTTTGSTPAGALVILTAIFWTGTGSVRTMPVTTAGGLTWQADMSSIAPVADYGMMVSSAPAPAGLASATDIEVTPTNITAGMNLCMVYVDGLDTSAGRVDGTPVTAGGTSSASWTTGSTTTTVADTILIAATMSDGSTPSNIVTTGPATEITGSEQYDTSNQWRSSASYLILSSAGSNSISGTFTGGSANFGNPAGVLAYEAGAAAAAAPSLHTIRANTRLT